MLCLHGDHACQFRDKLCSKSRHACDAVVDADAFPGFSATTDPVLKFFRAPEVAVALGLSDLDELRFADVTRVDDRIVVTYQHVSRLSDGNIVPVDHSRVQVEITQPAPRIVGVTSHLSSGLSLGPEPTLSTLQAIELGADAFAGSDVPVDLSLVSAQHARLTSVRVPASTDLGYADRYAWAMVFPRAPGLAGHRVVVDGETGEVLFFSKEGPLGVTPIAEIQPAFPIDPAADFFICVLSEGRGLDRFGIQRLFSTTAMPIKDFPGTRTFGTTSCPEIGRGIGQDEIVTFLLSPPDANGTQGMRLTNKVWSEDVFTNDFNVFADPSAVETQHWGEKAVTYAKKLGFDGRRTRAAKDDSPLAMRALMGPNAVVVPTAEWSAFSPDPNVPASTTLLQEGNGTMLFGIGSPGKSKSWSSPSVIAHEFFHSVLYDQWQLAKVAKLSPDYTTIAEGLAECFEMAFIHAYQGEIGFDQVPPSPFHLATGVFESVEDQEVGEPNLVQPRDSAEGQRLAWRGAVEEPETAHRKSTLISGACRLLIQGGHNLDPVYRDWAVTPGKDITHSLGWPVAGGPVDEEVAFERFEQLLFATVSGGRVTGASEIPDLIDAMAKHAGELAVSKKWPIPTSQAKDRVYRAFAVMGWGRGKEQEPNQPNDFAFVLDSSDAARNLIATGAHYSRPITGKACCGESKDKVQDFFVLDERVQGGTTISWSITKDPNSKIALGPMRVRIYLDKPCEFPDPTATSDSCSLQHQIAPMVNGQGLVKPDVGGESGQVVVPGNQRHIVFVGVSPANEPTPSSGGEYSLSVRLPGRTY